MTKQIDYYGTEDNYIHLKFGDCRKCFNFTEEFRKEYPEFAEEYMNYFWGEETMFYGAEDIVDYVFKKKIPVHFYFNYTDEPAESKAQILAYLEREN